jgi:hypothetical protein
VDAAGVGTLRSSVRHLPSSPTASCLARQVFVPSAALQPPPPHKHTRIHTHTNTYIHTHKQVRKNTHTITHTQVEAMRPDDTENPAAARRVRALACSSPSGAGLSRTAVNAACLEEIEGGGE